MKYLALLTLLFCFCWSGISQTKTYVVKKTDAPVSITGKGLDESWNNANILTEFLCPWEIEELPATRFRALWSKSHLYFLYHVEDNQIIALQRNLGEMDVVQSDRVEIFFKSADEKKPYYSLEMDVLGRCLDSEGIFNKKIDIDWDWPKNDFILKASKNEEGYIVEGAISFETLRQLGIYQDDGIINAGLYRGEYYHKDHDKITVKWISWVVGNAEKPNFHVPNSFGVLRLEN